MFVGGSAQCMSEAVHNVCRRQCTVYVGGSAQFMSEAVHSLCRRQCTIYVGGSAQCTSEAVHKFTYASCVASTSAVMCMAMIRSCKFRSDKFEL